MVIDPMSTTDEALAEHVESLLASVADFDLRREPFGWRMTAAECEVLVELVYRGLDGDNPSEPALELMRPLEDLGLKGSMSASGAIAALASGAQRSFTRVMLGAAPGTSRRQWLMLGATLSLVDLQVEELHAALAELREAC